MMFIVVFYFVIVLQNVFYLLSQVNSEEHANAEGEATVWTRMIPKDILAKVSGGKEIPAEKITVWIDPLDATQEYTGLWQVFISVVNQLRERIKRKYKTLNHLIVCLLSVRDCCCPRRNGWFYVSVAHMCCSRM